MFNPRKEYRVFQGRCLLLVGRDSKRGAFEQAKNLRGEGKFVRLVRATSDDYLIYAL